MSTPTQHRLPPPTSARSEPRWTRCAGPRWSSECLFVITYITSIAAKFAFYPPFLDNADYILGSGEDTRVLWGAFAEMVLIFANIGTAVALYPVLKRRFPVLSLGFVTARVMESVFIAVGILAVLTLVTMRQDFSGATAPRHRPRGRRPHPGHPAGVDVQPRPRRRRRRRQRPHPRLHDVPHRPGSPRHGDARTRRRPAHHPVWHRRHLRGHRGRLRGTDAGRACRSSSGSSASASTSS